MESTHTCLSVNINKIALIRNSRGGNLPDLVQMACDLEAYGAEGITVHPRPDQRHVRYDDIPALKAAIRTELNVEGYPSAEFIRLVIDNQPAQVTLVPDPPAALTSDHGWDIQKDAQLLQEVIANFKSAGIRVSLFIDPDENQVKAAYGVGADRIELYTGPYAHTYATDRAAAIDPHIIASLTATELGLGVNAGHDLNLNNLAWYRWSLPALDEVSIGHAMIADALYFGYSNVMHMYKDRLIHPQHYI